MKSNLEDIRFIRPNETIAGDSEANRSTEMDITLNCHRWICTHSSTAAPVACGFFHADFYQGLFVGFSLLIKKKWCMSFNLSHFQWNGFFKKMLSSRITCRTYEERRESEKKGRFYTVSSLPNSSIHFRCESFTSLQRYCAHQSMIN